MDNAVTVVVLTVILAGVHGQTIFDLLKPQPNGAQVMALLKSGGMKNAPKLTAIPENATYDCRAEQQAGYYADENFGCQVFYRCERDGKMSKYMCSTPAVFNQITLVCDYWYNVDCQKWVSLRNFANSRLYLDTTEQLFDNPPDDYQLPNFGNPAFPNINLPYVNRTKKPWLIKPVVTAPPRPNKPYTFEVPKLPTRAPVYTDGRTKPSATRRPTTASYFENPDTTEPTVIVEPDTTEPTKATPSRTKRPEGEEGDTDAVVTSGPLHVVSSTVGDYDQVEETTKPTLQPREDDGTTKAQTQQGVTPPVFKGSTEVLPAEATDAPTVPPPTRAPVTVTKGTSRPRTPKAVNRPLGKGGKNKIK